jgi:hypothetical protein
MLTTGLSATYAPRAITKFEMPAMSPTMTEGGIASWKKREGDSFIAGDVLLEIVRHKRRFALLLRRWPLLDRTGNGQGSYRRRSTRRWDYGQNFGVLFARDHDWPNF